MRMAFWNRILSLVLLFSMALSALSFLGCSSLKAGSTETAQTLETVPSASAEENKVPVAEKASEGDKAKLDSLYANRTAYHGDIHDHADTGPGSDGHENLTTWKTNLAALKMDFQAILDHRQVKHMYLPEWDDTVFLGGTEAAGGGIHYNLIVPDVGLLEKILLKYNEYYEFNGGQNGVAMEDGTFNYNGIGKNTMADIIADLREGGGMFVLAHPLQTNDRIGGTDDYYYGDYTGFEVFYMDYSSQDTKDNYNLWLKMLESGKRVWATAGCDRHRVPDAKALTTVYSEELQDDALLSHLSVGDFTCGFTGIRMCIGDTLMGSSTDFKGKKLILSVGDFHESMAREGRDYRIDILNEDGLVARGYMSDLSTHYFSVDADEDSDFYRVEVHDEKRKHSLIAIGQPIWND